MWSTNDALYHRLAHRQGAAAGIGKTGVKLVCRLQSSLRLQITSQRPACTDLATPASASAAFGAFPSVWPSRLVLPCSAGTSSENVCIKGGLSASTTSDQLSCQVFTTTHGCYSISHQVVC